jgi:cell division protein FtsB
VLRLHSPTIEPISKQLTIVVGLTVVGFMAFGLALSFYRNILFEQTLSELEAQNQKIADEIAEGDRTLEYYKSDQFKDKYAKENLSKLNPGEKVLIITQAPSANTMSVGEDANEKERKEAAYSELLRQMPVIEHWKLYLLHRERMEEFKRSL